MTARVNADDLDAATRRRLGVDGTRRRTKPEPTKAGSGGFNLVCHACGYVPKGVTDADRHTATEGHHRWHYPTGEEDR